MNNRIDEKESIVMKPYRYYKILQRAPKFINSKIHLQIKPLFFKF